MDKFGMGAMGLGPLPGMSETMDFVRRAWSSFNLPSGMTPTLDVDEIDRRIADLRTVEQWLTLNLNMVQSAIQGLEIQRGTLAALKAFGDAVGGSAGLDPAAVARAMAMTMAPNRTPHSANETPPAPEPTQRPATHSAPDADPATRAGGSPEGGAAKPADAATEAANPAVWWNLLQGQFSQLAQAALAGAAAVAPAFTGAGTEAAGTQAAQPASARTPDASQERKRPAGKAAARKPGRRPAPPTG